MVVRTEKVPYLVFARLRGIRPYAPGRVLRKLEGKQELPLIADMRYFALTTRMDELHLLKTYLGCGNLEKCWVNLYQTGFVQSVLRSTKNG